MVEQQWGDRGTWDLLASQSSLLGELYFYEKYSLHGYSVTFEENN